MWVCIWTMHGQDDYVISLWNSENDALVAAGARIMQEIGWWDLSIPDNHKMAYLISDECAAMNWRVAIDLYNTFEDKKNRDVRMHLSVFERNVPSKLPSVSLLRPLPAAPVQTQAVAQQKPAAPAPVAFKANQPGSTCRGPCKNYDPFAYADQPNGTHICYQCKYMSQVFGASSP